MAPCRGDSLTPKLPRHPLLLLVPQGGRSRPPDRTSACLSAEQTPPGADLCSARVLGCCAPTSARAMAEGVPCIHQGGGGGSRDILLTGKETTNPRFGVQNTVGAVCCQELACPTAVPRGCSFRFKWWRGAGNRQSRPHRNSVQRCVGGGHGRGYQPLFAAAGYVVHFFPAWAGCFCHRG